MALIVTTYPIPPAQPVTLTELQWRLDLSAPRLLCPLGSMCSSTCTILGRPQCLSLPPPLSAKSVSAETCGASTSKTASPIAQGGTNGSSPR